MPPIRDEAPPPAAPVTDAPPPIEPPPPAAPVTEAPPTQAAPAAPVTEPERMQVGAHLAEWLLIIAAGAIVGLVAYLALLDSVTSAQVNNLYDRTFQQMLQTPVPPDISGIDAASKLLQSARATPETAASGDDAKKLRNVVDQLKLPGRVTAQNATRLDQCVQLVSTTTDPKDTQK